MTSATRTNRRLSAIAAIGAVAVLVPGVAVAATSFKDVSSNHAHRTGIGYVADAGITAGCGDGTRYCPTDAVTRGQMATFLHRASGNASGVAPSVNAATLDGRTAADLAGPAVAFSATLSTGEEAVLLENGPLRYVASCSDDAGASRLRIHSTSSVDGWYDVEHYGSDGQALAAGAQVRYVDTVESGEAFYNYIDGGSAIAPGGEYASLQLETMSLGFNVLGHDCLVAGVGFVQKLGL